MPRLPRLCCSEDRGVPDLCNLLCLANQNLIALLHWDALRLKGTGLHRTSRLCSLCICMFWNLCKHPYLLGRQLKRQRLAGMTCWYLSMLVPHKQHKCSLLLV